MNAQITGIDEYLLPIIAVVVVISLSPVALELRRMRREQWAAPSVPDTSPANDHRPESST